MKILYTLNSGNPGGMEKHVCDLVEGMSKDGHEVYVWCKKGDIVKWYKEAGAKEVVTTGINLDIDLSYILRLSRFLKKKKIEVVHTHELKAVVNTLIAANLAGTPVRISHTHTPIKEWQTNNPIKKLFWGPTSLFYALIVNLFSTKEIALTESRRKVKIGEGISPSKLEVIPNGINVADFDLSVSQRAKYRNEILDQYKIKKNAVVFGNISRLTQEKGHADFLNAFAQFLRYPITNKKDFYLLIAGGGVLEKALKKQAKDLDILDKVIFTGAFLEEDKMKILSAIDVFVFPSLAEGFGIVLIEAMLMGIPVLCSDLPVLKEVGKDVIEYFITGNSHDMAEKMEKIYNDLSFEKYDAKKGIDLVRDNYSVATFIQSYLKLYINLLSKKI